jgi:hypothetical protein
MLAPKGRAGGRGGGRARGLGRRFEQRPRQAGQRPRFLEPGGEGRFAGRRRGIDARASRVVRLPGEKGHGREAAEVGAGRKELPAGQPGGIGPMPHFRCAVDPVPGQQGPGPTCLGQVEGRVHVGPVFPGQPDEPGQGQPGGRQGRGDGFEQPGPFPGVEQGKQGQLRHDAGIMPGGQGPSPLRRGDVEPCRLLGAQATDEVHQAGDCGVPRPGRRDEDLAGQGRVFGLGFDFDRRKFPGGRTQPPQPEIQQRLRGVDAATGADVLAQAPGQPHFPGQGSGLGRAGGEGS